MSLLFIGMHRGLSPMRRPFRTKIPLAQIKLVRFRKHYYKYILLLPDNSLPSILAIVQWDVYRDIFSNALVWERWDLSLRTTTITEFSRKYMERDTIGGGRGIKKEMYSGGNNEFLSRSSSRKVYPLMTMAFSPPPVRVFPDLSRWSRPSTSSGANLWS